MTKTLRSIIKENFDMDFLVELELLSKRRNIKNAAKQEELVKMFQNRNMDITQLGPGTNRYAFKFKGYAIKFATNNDGRIDNMKEFKMARMLYPYVVKVHEILKESGTILVTEYIQPFDNIFEMRQHEAGIRRILTELSQVYLIGDVWISDKNYANWGLRIGTNQPVCLDFAYIYSISSELFLCRNSKCHAHSLLVPTENFANLVCRACGNSTTFEDVRRMIGNNIANHDIGDLGDVGYVLTESNSTVTLDPVRSSYLKVEPAEPKQKNITVKDPPVIDTFVMSEPLKDVASRMSRRRY